MSSVQPTSRILVTGANGFIGAHCVADLLSKGFKVVGTVRTVEKSKQIVSDVTDPHASDEAIRECTGVLHLAAPFGYTYKDFETELLIPSINGTRSICLSATKAISVKRVVITSSFASVFDESAGPSPGRVYTEKDWSRLTYDDGKNAAATPIAYRASKVLAEKTVNGVWPWFPGTVKSLDALNTSNGIVWGLFDAGNIPETKAPLWTSVKALARAHTLALTTRAAGNEHFLVLNGDFDNQELADIIHSSSSIPPSAKSRVPVGKPGDRLKAKVFTATSEKIITVLELDLKRKYESLEKTVEQLVQQLLHLEAATNL